MTETSDPVQALPETGPPTQFLTFLIADVRGYTSFTVEHGSKRGATLAMRFATLARDLVAARDGEVIELRGDEALAVFDSPQQAIRAAVEMQQRFRAEMEEDPSLPLKVGIGLDAGDVVPVEGGYRGLALNLAARLCSLARAGEVYGTEGLIQHAERLEGLAYVERGRVALKGFSDLVRVIQVLPEADLPSGFPPLTSPIAKPSNLPLQSTTFVGREREVETLAEMLRRKEVRLLTLTGPGGTGKTRLALQVGSAVLDDFERGVFFVPMASINDPGLVVSAVASTLKVREAPGQPLLETLKEYLREREMLLLLDNFEHVLDAAPIVAELLAACPDLKVLVTSRSVLHLTGEHDYAVPPLSVPDLRRLPTLDDLLQYDAVALFVQRAQAAKIDFVLSQENARPVAEICARVEGLPLAIELAAARVKVFPPQTLLRRLSQRLSLLTGGARDLPTRQQTLRATIDWSFSLLDEEEQKLFARLSVFAGGCTLQAAEAVCKADGEIRLDLLKGACSLVDKSLLRQEGDQEEPRFRMLETIREYALQRLQLTGDVDPVQRRHAAYYMNLAEEAEPAFRSPEQEVWLGQLEKEHDNMRAALGWALQGKDDDLALRLSSALHRFWQVHGHLSEGRQWLEQSLAHAGAVRTPIQVEALVGAGWLALYQNDVAAGQRFLEEGLALARELEDEAGAADAMYALGHAAALQADFERAMELYEESLALYLDLNDTWGIALATNDLGGIALAQGDYERAHELLEEGLVLARHLGQRRAVGILTFNLGYASWCQGDFERAKALYEESLPGFREVGDKVGIAMTLDELGMVTALLGDHERATELLEECLTLFRELDHRLGLAEWLENQARVAAFQGQPARAARLHGAADALREALGAPLSAADRAVHDRDLASARAQVGDAWAAIWDSGKEMSLEQAIEYALEAAPAC